MKTKATVTEETTDKSVDFIIMKAELPILRIIFHYSELLSDKDKANYPIQKPHAIIIAQVNENLGKRYAIAKAKAKKIGAKPYKSTRHENYFVLTGTNYFDMGIMIINAI